MDITKLRNYIMCFCWGEKVCVCSFRHGRGETWI